MTKETQEIKELMVWGGYGIVAALVCLAILTFILRVARVLP